jgi:hypothetical protein
VIGRRTECQHRTTAIGGSGTRQIGITGTASRGDDRWRGAATGRAVSGGGYVVGADNGLAVLDDCVGVALGAQSRSVANNCTRVVSRSGRGNGGSNRQSTS